MIKNESSFSEPRVLGYDPRIFYSNNRICISSTDNKGEHRALGPAKKNIQLKQSQAEVQHKDIKLKQRWGPAITSRIQNVSFIWRTPRSTALKRSFARKNLLANVFGLNNGNKRWGPGWTSALFWLSSALVRTCSNRTNKTTRQMIETIVLAQKSKKNLLSDNRVGEYNHSFFWSGGKKLPKLSRFVVSPRNMPTAFSQSKTKPYSYSCSQLGKSLQSWPRALPVFVTNQRLKIVKI